MVFGGVIKLNKKGYSLICCLFLISLYFHFKNKTKEFDNYKISLSSLLETAVLAAEVGGESIVLMKSDLKVQSKGKTEEGLEDSVTQADLLSHCAMKNIMTSRFPLVKFISEEKDISCEINKLQSVSKNLITEIPDEIVNVDDVTVWIDPLDATHEFTEKLYQYVTTMVCVAVNGEPVIGVIHNPFNKNTSWAVVGKGYSNDLKLLKNDEYHPKNKIIISRSHSGTVKEILNKNFKNFEVITAAGAGYKALSVAKGEADAYVHITAIKKWDICPGNAILNALGGKMTTKHGKTLTYFNESDVVNKEGLIATLRNHELYVNKL